jgi:NitT/TauT family transport system substrate-binding protein
MQQGKVDLAFTLADALSDAVAGTGPFAQTGSVANARTVAVLYTNYTHLVVRDGSGVHKVADLRGKVVSVGSQGSGTELLADRVLAAAGLDPRKDINWITRPPVESMQLLADSKIDAYLGFPPEPQELRAKKIGHVMVNSVIDRPWSQYFCCMIAGNREFVKKYPVATKRAMRAILKAADHCSVKPDQSAQFLVDKKFNTTQQYASQMMKEIPYGKWRDYDPEDTLRFYALRLHEAGMIKSSPQKIISQGTDWRFLRELKKELKA